MSAHLAYRALVDAGVDLVTGVPDSLFSPLWRLFASERTIRCLQAADEATAIAVAAGARLAGARSLVVMENSGLRRGCETLSRLTLSHRLHTLLLISRRGAFGEANWWGIAHEETMAPHLSMLSMATSELDSVEELPGALAAAYAMLDTGQRSVALIANPSFTAGLRGAE